MAGLVDSSAFIRFAHTVTQTSRVCQSAARVSRRLHRLTWSSALLAWIQGPFEDNISDHVAHVMLRSPAVTAVDGWLVGIPKVWRDARTGRIVRNAVRHYQFMDPLRRSRRLVATGITAALTYISLTPKEDGYYGLGSLAVLLVAIGFAIVAFRDSPHAQKP